MKLFSFKNLPQILLFNLLFNFTIVLWLLLINFLPKDYYTAFLFKIISFIIFQIFVLSSIHFFNNKFREKNKLLYFLVLFKRKIIDGTTIAVLKIIIFNICLSIFRFGLQRETILGFFLAFTALWIFFTCILILLWFPVFNLLNGNKVTPAKGSMSRQLSAKLFIQNLKNSFLFFIEKPFFTFLFFLKTIFLLLISAFTLFLFPGFAGILFFISSSKNIAESFYKSLQHFEKIDKILIKHD